ncbi:hypothetical protein APA66_13065 [Pseudomonas aeruginosa]|uniref:hypothetical protein n=1 Tax=Pseudomonas aeruginosa TaxID=287 RepID=UPI00071B108F|nr:hypothetical protein [Pseudomonas aeruginosa]KSM53944.1 hypothetical protein APA66_13065 [Pseudomonas aeruginosa]HEI9900913.1 hypothetical protein [Pseudomonas aeruginosa]
MNESKICTCPSGDGSLRWPCPAHPAVEQAGGDERAAFELFVRKHCGMPAHIAVNWDAKFTNDAWEGWQARAALAQPSPPPHPAPELDFSRPLETENGDPVKWICADVIEYKSARVCVAKDTGLVYSSPYIGLKIRNVMPEQAEAEGAEIVATLFTPNEKVHNVIGFKAFAVAGDCDKDGGEFYDPEKLMTVAQHERIVRALRAVITQLRQHKNDYMDAGQETYRALQNEIRDREAEIARLDGLVSGRTAERDAALARVAELELKLDKSDYAYDNDRIHMRGLAARAIARAKVFDDGSDGADAESARSVVAILRELLAVGPAQAQHSVPEGYALIPVRETEAMHDAVMALLYKGVARTDTQKLLDAYIAAAPGKEVGHE